MRTATRRLFVVLAATVLIVMLASLPQDEGDHFRWFVAPVVALLLVVVVFGLLALLRSALKAMTRVHLAVDKGAGLVSGFSARKTVAGLRIEPLASLKSLELDVRKGAGENPRDPKSWATLELLLEDGTRLEAPEAWGPNDSAEAVEALLLPLGVQLSKLSGRPLKVTHLWSGETREVN